MRKLVLMAAIALAVTATAHDEEEFAEMRAKMTQARAKMADAAKQIAEVTRRQFAIKPDRAFLGVLIADQDGQGVAVGGVTPDSGAEVAGVLADDLIVKIDGQVLTGLDRPGEKLREVLDEVSPGDTVKLVILRDGDSSDVDVTTTAYGDDRMLHIGLGDFDWVPKNGWSEPFTALRSRFGRPAEDLRLVDIGEDLGDYFGVDAGVLVLDTPAKSDLRPGDIIKRVNGADVGSSEEAYRLLRSDADEQVSVQVRRKNRSIDVAVAPLSGKGRVFFMGSRAEDEDEAHEEVEIELKAAQ